MRRSGPKAYFLPIGSGLLGAAALAGVYFGLVSWAESPEHAWFQFLEDALFVVPILLGFGFQVALFTVLRWRLFLPQERSGVSGAVTGVGGGTSAAAMVACCAHHVTDVLPIVGLTAATSVLAQYREAFLAAGLAMTLGGSIYMVRVLRKERKMYTAAEGVALEGART